MNATMLPSAVELRLREKRGGLAQDLIRALQLAILSLQLLQPLPLVSRQVWALTGIPLRLSHPPLNCSVMQPSLPAMDAIAAHWEGCFGPCS